MLGSWGVFINPPLPHSPTPLLLHSPPPMTATNSNPNDDHSEGFAQGEILSAIKQPASALPPPSAPTTAPFNPLDMASLAGLKPADPAESSLATTETVQVENIAESKTKLPIYKQSFFKLITIGGALLIACLALGSIVFKDAKQEVAAAPTPTPSPSTKPTEDFKPDPRFGVVNSKLAMESQQRQIIDAAVAQQKASADKTAADKVAADPATGNPPAASLNANSTPPTSESNPQIVKSTTPQPDPVYQAPPPVNISTPAPTPTTAPVAVKPTPVRTTEPVRRVIEVAPKPTRIATLIRPQPIIPSVPRSLNSMPKAIPVTWEVANSNAVGVWGKTGTGNQAAVVVTTTAPNERRIASSSPSTGTAAVGQQIKSKLVIPYQAVTTAPSQPIFIALSTPVLDTQGKTLLPAGTQIMCEVAALDNGMLQVSSAKASIDGQLVDLPKQAIILQNSSKQPLVAQVKSFGQGEVFNRDLMGFAGGALSAIGKNLTQPQTQTIATSGGFLQTSNPQQNILGSVLDGGFSPLVSQWMERNKQATTQINSASKIYFLPTGTEVNLIISQPFSF